MGMGMAIPGGLTMGDHRNPLMAASYGGIATPTGPLSAPHSLLARPLLQPLQPPPTKKLRMDDSAMSYKTGVFSITFSLNLELETIEVNIRNLNINS